MAKRLQPHPRSGLGYPDPEPCVFCHRLGCREVGIVVIDDQGTPAFPCQLVSMHFKCFSRASKDGYTASTQ